MSRSKESFSPYTTEYSRKITFQAARLTNLGHSCYHGGCTVQPRKSDPEVEISQAALDTHVMKTELLGSPARKIPRLKEGIGGCGSDRVTLQQGLGLEPRASSSRNVQCRRNQGEDEPVGACHATGPCLSPGTQNYVYLQKKPLLWARDTVPT